MIHSIRANAPGFKAMEFQPGLNIVIAERAHAPDSKETANSVGKSSLVELFYLALGGQPSNKSPLKDDVLDQYVVDVKLDVGSNVVQVTKRLNDRETVFVRNAEGLLGPDAPNPAPLPRDQWKKALGRAWWNLETDESEENKNLPTAGKLLRYVTRIVKAGGFERADKGYSQEKDIDSGANAAFLLGLPWEAAGAWGEIAPRQKLLRELRSRQGLRFFREAFGDAESLAKEEAELQASIAELEEATRGKNLEVGRTKLLEEAEASQSEAVRVGNQLFEAKRGLRVINKALTEQTRDAKARDDVANLPGQLGETVKRKLEEIELFHERVLANRVAYLTEERSRLEAEATRLERVHVQVAELARQGFAAASDEGAWKQFERQAVLLASKRGRLETVQARLKALRSIDTESLDINERKRELKAELEGELQKSKDVLDYLDREFRAIVHAAYGKDLHKANLEFEATREKLAVKPSIESGAGEGVGAAQIWAFDLLVKHMESKLGFQCKTLVHDSALFDPMDKEQIPGFLQVAGERAEREGWQYIVTLHGSVLALDGKDAWLGKFVNPVRLTDAPDGGLFGIRF